MDFVQRFVIDRSFHLRYYSLDAYLYRAVDQVAWDADITHNRLFWDIWSAFMQPRSLVDAVETLSDYDPDEVAAAIEGMCESGIIEPVGLKDRQFDPLTAELSHVPQAWDYHLVSSRIDWINYLDGKDVKRQDLEQMDKHLSEEAVPSNFHKAANSRPKYDLPSLVPLTAFEFNNSASVAFGHEKAPLPNELSLDIITLLLNYAAAKTDTVNMYATGEHLRKAVPSGGARHPIEFYVVVGDEIAGIEAGVYHYNVRHHRLDAIEIASTSLKALQEASSVLPRSRSKPFGFAFIHTCRFERSMFRYREPRSYRVMQFDLGHIHANEVLAAKILGLDFSETFSVPESIVESVLTLDPFIESAMSAFVVHRHENHHD
ncbi:SagB/ThcOx family dehydrogenase [Rhizobium anhuiense]|uniref:SagB/ThcOx family dehydrogenase n=1 Tax=Rhizobium anhuiense TaxID=1184720 RepID=UPI0015CF45E0|nr:SagB/ThcOx family dehydrogenase [Rhizobium anhuiense]